MPDLSESRTQFTDGSHPHADNTTEQDVLEFVNLKDLIHISVDLNDFVQELEIRVFEKIDNINYRQMAFKTFPTDYETGAKAITVVLDGGKADMKFTFKSTVQEGSVKNALFTIRETTRKWVFFGNARVKVILCSRFYFKNDQQIELWMKLDASFQKKIQKL